MILHRFTSKRCGLEDASHSTSIQSCVCFAMWYTENGSLILHPRSWVPNTADKIKKEGNWKRFNDKEDIEIYVMKNNFKMIRLFRSRSETKNSQTFIRHSYKWIWVYCLQVTMGLITAWQGAEYQINAMINEPKWREMDWNLLLLFSLYWMLYHFDIHKQSILICPTHRLTEYTSIYYELWPNANNNILSE